ncbi:hypothetical protein SPHINGO8BC_10080 [Sphingobacterium multivorum]|uniref:Uncharacterized protein n=1 Tax=Sphingobacterium multivorum TaxID=28454 RepID=A0A653XNB3_SPHMU|nr:hypothetical protein SPHINGO8BC_10080 [Sphingobacterium multivorum]
MFQIVDNEFLCNKILVPKIKVPSFVASYSFGRIWHILIIGFCTDILFRSVC